MLKKSLNINGMTCEHCVETIEDIVGSILGVKNIEVDLAKKLAKVEFDDNKTKLANIKEKIIGAGFEIS